MSLKVESKHYEDYYDHVLNKKKTKGTLGKVFNLIADISDRRGLKHEWNGIDGDVQDSIIEDWSNIIRKPRKKNN